MAVTPAGAEVSSVVATNWKKIWKKKLQKQADKRYYTKKKSNAKYAKKTDLAATDAKLGGYYTKAEADAKYAPYPKTLRGTYLASTQAPGAGAFAFDTINYGATLNAAPTVVFVPGAGPADPNCTGSAAAPAAAAGYLCIYEGSSANTSGFTFASSAGATGVPSTFGIVVRFTANAAGLAASVGGWAVTPATGVTSDLKAPSPGGGGGGALLP